MQVQRQFIEQVDESALRFIKRKIFKVDHQAMKLVAGEESGNFLTEAGTRCRIIQKTGYIDPVRTVEIVHQRENFRPGIFRLQKRHDFIVNGMNHSVLDHVERLICLLIDTLQMPIRGEHVQPFRVEQVELAGVFAERRKAGSIPGNVECAPNSFIGVQLYLRGRNPGAAMGTLNEQFSPLPSSFFFIFAQRMIRVLLKLKKQLRQGFATQRRINENNYYRTEDKPSDVEQRPKSPPSGAARIVKNRFRHACAIRDILAGETGIIKREGHLPG